MNNTKQLLRINLKKKTTQVEEIPEEICKKYVGGLGLALYYYIQEVAPTTGALDAKNKLIFATGPLTGTKMSSSGRVTLVSKSPINGAIGESHAGTRWGPELKMAGYDLLIVEERAKKPVYLYIDDEKIEIESASDLWSKTTLDVTGDLYLKYGRMKNYLEDLGQTTIAVIGKAGENLVPYASILFEKHRAAGACGMGAVMGSKNLKAIVVRGEKSLTYTDAAEFEKLSAKWNEALENDPLTGDLLPKIGTGYFLGEGIKKHAIHLCDALQNSPEALKDYEIQNLVDLDDFKDSPCSNLCTVTKCGKYVTMGEKTFYVPQFASLWALGPNLGITDYTKIIELNELCNMYGLDTVQFSNIANLLMQATEKGRLTGKLAKFQINYNEADKFSELITEIGEQKNRGKNLSKSLVEIAENLQLVDILLNINGFGISGLDIELGGKGITQALSYITSLVSGSFNKSFHFVKELFDGETPQNELGKVVNLVFLENYYSLIDSLVLCKFATFAYLEAEDKYGLNLMTQALGAVTGIKYTPEDLVEVGERIINLQYSYNVKAGNHISIEAAKGLLQANGDAADEMEGLFTKYLQERDWQNVEHPVPTSEKIESLKLTTELNNVPS